MTTNRLHLRRSLRLAAAGLLLFAICAACTYTEGERSASGTCPEGETCSDAVAGLTFYGALPGENQGSLDFLRTVAMGGTQRLSIDTVDGTELGAVDVVSSAPWFLTVATFDEPPVGDLGVEVSGLAEGDSFVRVLAPGSDELYDRVSIRVARIETVEPTVLAGGDALAGQRASVVFQLLSEQGDRLVDEGMTITSPDVEVERISWDCIDFVAPSGAEEVTFQLEAGHRRWAVTVPVR